MKRLERILFILAIFIIWQILSIMNVFPELLFPAPVTVFRALIHCFTQENMLGILQYSLSLIFYGMLYGCGLGLLFSILSVLSSSFKNIYNMVIAIMDPIPGIAILPLAILWFGTGEQTIIVIIIHSVVWPISRNIIDGFAAVPKAYVEVGQNIGLSPISMVTGIYCPAAFPYILSGLKVGWARSWRALISAEMIFGVSGSIGGLGWFIFKKRYSLETDYVFATLIIIILIGLLVEYAFFAQLEKRTVKKWGMIK